MSLNYEDMSWSGKHMEKATVISMLHAAEAINTW